jgi:hypothetical protein
MKTRDKNQIFKCAYKTANDPLKHRKYLTEIKIKIETFFLEFFDINILF